MYLSINGDQANCSIVLLTADNIAGPYLYQGPVVFSGFYNTANSAVSYKNTDLELVLGEQAFAAYTLCHRQPQRMATPLAQLHRPLRVLR